MTTKTARFGPLAIRYDERVLSPRPWTLAQAEWGAELAAAAPDGPVLELCAGAGHIGLALLQTTGRRLVQVDVDDSACSFAGQNAAACGMADRVDVRVGDMAAVLGTHERFPLILADPPYVTTSETARFPADPIRAIDGGPDGLRYVRLCLQVIATHLAPGGAALLQLRDATQVSMVEVLVADAYPSLGTGEARLHDRGALLRVDRVIS